MAKGWYILHVFSGHENKVEKYIQMYLDEGVYGDVISDVKVPSEEVSEKVNGKTRVVKKKILPGYVMLEMDLPERGWKKTCVAIRRIQSVLGFLGTMGDSKPQPISSEEAKAILQKAGAIKADKGLLIGQDYVAGEKVRVTEGPFESFSGVIEKVMPEKGKLQVVVGIFGRSTPVEVEYQQVERV
ncbi:transcription termination/antitermination factor NusG [Thiospirochaeta perfilievii]|uniref:Transcription termination/antitermination protein NusG n=1 Tax=Thiospirochaeta perfilievii TaxID=252967 RepID=A0A5C1QCF6_9SPIO|nr:transcription termination/antitermination protein NusG [Thiospirochaeta perfilievii]QEN05147.1 transcription termination/antitermination factor NusG [Thiospirochaeta perfilievii]